ncbi:hypothetical protein L2E82_38574 [Cichorium intybus]|uniref:Uncharacterized protein n=1 Tax=Cichorium intybus TaxID=13427 RepID=A0ACB9AH71_CICIN|nr:hypothetical protein L2E82_38574 [Cichorium intybus]
MIRMNKGIKNRIKIDLREQCLGEGMKILKHHLIFGVYRRSLWQLQVITGCHGSRRSVLKQSVVDILKRENIKWREESSGCLLITFDGQKRELGFVECGRFLALLVLDLLTSDECGIRMIQIWGLTLHYPKHSLGHWLMP